MGYINLSDKNKDVCTFICMGFTLVETARVIGITKSCVASRLHRIYNQLNINTPKKINLILFLEGK